MPRNHLAMKILQGAYVQRGNPRIGSMRAWDSHTLAALEAGTTSRLAHTHACGGKRTPTAHREAHGNSHAPDRVADLKWHKPLHRPQQVPASHLRILCGERTECPGKPNTYPRTVGAIGRGCKESVRRNVAQEGTQAHVNTKPHFYPVPTSNSVRHPKLSGPRTQNARKTLQKR
jgi:hypothetical protein